MVVVGNRCQWAIVRYSASEREQGPPPASWGNDQRGLSFDGDHLVSGGDAFAVMQVNGPGGLDRVLEALACSGPAYPDGAGAVGQGYCTFGTVERAGEKGQGIVPGAEVVSRRQAECVSGELPGGAPGPLMAVRPSGVKDFNPGGSIVLEGPAPTLAVLVEDEVHHASLDQQRHGIVCEVGGDQAALVAAGIAQAWGVAVVGEAPEYVGFHESDAFLLGSGLEEPQLQAQGGAVITDLVPVESLALLLRIEVSADDGGDAVGRLLVVGGPFGLVEFAAPADHVSEAAEVVEICADVDGAFIADVSPVDEGPAKVVLDAIGGDGLFEGSDVSFGGIEEFFEQGSVAGEFPVVYAGGDPLRRVGGEEGRSAGAESGDEAVFTGALGTLNEPSAA